MRKARNNQYIVTVDGIPFPSINLAAKKMGTHSRNLRYHFRDIMDVEVWASSTRDLFGHTVEMNVYGWDVLNAMNLINGGGHKTDDQIEQGDNYED